jgi:glutathione S-transferase
MTASGLTLFELAGADSELRFSPHCWKTRMALAHKGLEADRVPWRFVDKAKIAFSGQSLVPVLVHGDESISDSWRIALYLEECFPAGPSLFGATRVIPVAHFVNSWADATLLPAIARIILVDIYNCVDARDRSYLRSSREKYFGMSLEAVVADQPAHLSAFRTALQPLRRMLKNQDFICGEAPAYADYCVFGMFMWARCCSTIELLEDDDHVHPWRERLLDSFGGLARSAPSRQYPDGRPLVTEEGTVGAPSSTPSLTGGLDRQ